MAHHGVTPTVQGSAQCKHRLLGNFTQKERRKERKKLTFPQSKLLYHFGNFLILHIGFCFLSRKKDVLCLQIVLLSGVLCSDYDEVTVYTFRQKSDWQKTRNKLNVVSEVIIILWLNFLYGRTELNYLLWIFCLTVGHQTQTKQSPQTWAQDGGPNPASCLVPSGTQGNRKTIKAVEVERFAKENLQTWSERMDMIRKNNSVDFFISELQKGSWLFTFFALYFTFRKN